MDWTRTKLQTSTVLCTHTDASDFDEVVPALVEWLKALLDELMGLQQSFEWNRISVEIWLDSGRLIGYPALGCYEVSQWPVAVEVRMPFLITEYERALPEDEDEQAVSVLEYRVWMAIRQAFRSQEVKRRFNNLKKSKVFTIWRQSQGDLSTSSEFMI